MTKLYSHYIYIYYYIYMCMLRTFIYKLKIEIKWMEVVYFMIQLFKDYSIFFD